MSVCIGTYRFNLVVFKIKLQLFSILCSKLIKSVKLTRHHDLTLVHIFLTEISREGCSEKTDLK